MKYIFLFLSLLISQSVQALSSNLMSLGNSCTQQKEIVSLTSHNFLDENMYELEAFGEYSIYFYFCNDDNIVNEISMFQRYIEKNIAVSQYERAVKKLTKKFGSPSFDGSQLPKNIPSELTKPFIFNKQWSIKGMEHYVSVEKIGYEGKWTFYYRISMAQI
ncbi:hypothetical protein RI845_06800 [Thalassotalea nanhaiensis]|uniref:Chalcone isomerase domain-containing protein n=1 Tax=Thalassotalea nanhaiensis TaxID=3065648 RepID=A0ABY9TLY1_9GAMM|nr:hypothetical protein RI845_06800 [Colwelliaceae bacterium SQ345]